MPELAFFIAVYKFHFPYFALHINWNMELKKWNPEYGVRKVEP